MIRKEIPAVAMLRRAYRLMQRSNLSKNTFYDKDPATGQECYCTTAVCGFSCGPVKRKGQTIDRDIDWEVIGGYVMEALGVDHYRDVFEWNDAPWRSKNDVLGILHKATNLARRERVA